MVQSSASPSEETKKFKILLLEDQGSFRQFIKESLHRQFPKMLIEDAGDGIEALQKVTSFTPDLIFMDIQLPGESGLELTKKIKGWHPHIRIVIMTLYDLPEYRKAAKRYGVQDFVTKGLTTWSEIVGLVKSASSKIAKPI